MTVPSIPNYQPRKPEDDDPVKRSLQKPDAFAKPATLGSSRVRVRITAGDPSLKRRKKKRRDKRDVQFY